MTNLSDLSDNYLNLPRETNWQARFIASVFTILSALILTGAAVFFIVLYSPLKEFRPIRFVFVKQLKYMFPDRYLFKNDQEKEVFGKAVITVDPREKIKYFEEAIAINPSAQNYFLLGLANWEALEKEDAKNSFEKALEKDPKHVLSLTYLGYLFGLKSGLNNMARGKELLLKSIEIDPVNTQGYYFLALLLSEREEYAQAKQFIDLAVALQPDNPKYEEIKDELAEIVKPK